MTISRKLILAGSLSLALVSVSWAQMAAGVTSDTLRLDFDTAWKMALEHNESLQIARNNERKAQQQVKGAYSAAMPTVDLNGTFNHYFQIPSTIFYLPGAMNPPTFERLRVKTQFGSENNVTANVQLTQPLWLAGKVGLVLTLQKPSAS
jgi:outer membrane protein TolC